MDIGISRLRSSSGGGPTGAMGGALGGTEPKKPDAGGREKSKDGTDFSEDLGEMAEMVGKVAGSVIKGILSAFGGGGGESGGAGGSGGAADGIGSSGPAPVGGGGGNAGSPNGAGGAGSAGGAGGAGGAPSANGAAPQEVKPFIQFAAQAYGANASVLEGIAQRESNFNTGDIANNTDSNAKKGTPSKGMFQFIEPTFESMMPQAKAANPQAWQGVSENWTDWKAQALTCAWAITHGKGNQWSTYQAAVAGAGGGGGNAVAA